MNRIALAKDASPRRTARSPELATQAMRPQVSSCQGAWFV